MMAFVLSVPIWAGEKTIVINRNEGIYEDGTGAYYCTKGGITMTFSSGLNNVNYLVEHQQVVFDIFSTNYVIKKIKFNCLDNTLEGNMDCFYWGPTTISEFNGAPYEPTGSYVANGYIGTWTGGSTPSKYVKFVTRGKPVRFGSVEITIDKEFGDIYDLVTLNSEITAGQTYALVSKYDSRAMGKEEYHGDDPVKTFSSTPVELLNFDENQNNYMKVKVTDEVSLMKLESSGYSSRPWYIKIGDNYLRRRTGDMQGSGGPSNGEGWNIYTVSNVASGSESYFRTNITVENNNRNALIRFEHNSSETSGGKTFAIRHYNGGDLFRVIDYNTSNNQYANNQRVYLYKPAQTYYVTTNCQPNDNSGYITLGEGVLNDGNGNYTSQQYDNVNFFVGPTDGWGVGAVTVTNLSTNEVTTLTPTATGDFGNDYNFPMPAANVNVTANFLPPVEIDTICNPADGGQFNFINGYTNFSGQYYSNEGKTVTFKPTAAEGYIFQSVTITDNGVTTTMTPDADGVYSFVMPGHEVTLTANFEAAHDLYLLGTANGRTGWIPSGPKFNFDGQKYYLDVYFKGGNDSQQVDPAYGYFSLTKKIDENGIWNNINGYRLGAEYNNYWVENGSTAQLWPDRNDNAFKIPPGVYRIEVNQEMTQISIIEYPLTVTFDPATGTVVDAGDVVNFTSNLNDLVHAINSQEDQATYNSYDNWGATTSDNTHTITHDGITTVTGQSHIGYITATGTADYEIIGDLYLLGTANGGSWAPTGPKFTFDGENYYIDVYFKGGNVGQYDDPAYGYFSLTTQVGNDWNDIKNYRLAAQTNNYGVADGSTGVGLYGGEQYINNAFKIPAGVYRITVNKAKTEMSITEYPLTLTFDPVSGTTVAAGDPVNISSNLDQLVHGINPDEPLHAEITYATSTDGSLPTPDTAGSTVNITAVGATTTVNAQAALGYITVTGNANYNVPAPTVYSITTVVLPEGSGAGTITAPSGSESEQTVTFTVTNNDPAAYTLSDVEVYNSYGALLDVTDNGDGTYTFTMPNDDVTIRTTYVPTQYTVTTSWTPIDGGAIWLNGVNTPQTVSIDNGAAVPFGISTAPGYELVSFTVTNTTTGEEITTTPSGSNEYTFTMPTSNVTVSAEFKLSDLYLLGTVMGRATSVSSGPKFNYDAENEQYYLDVYFTGVNGQLSAFDFFALATHVSDFDWRNRGATMVPNDPSWASVTGRLAPDTDNYLVDGNSVDVPLSNDPQATGTTTSFTNDFKIPAGIYRITVNKAKTLMSITEVPVHITFTPHGGTVDNPTIVESGQQVTIDSDIQSLVNEIDQAQGLTELQQIYLIKDNPESGWTESDNILITKEGQTTVYGYIVIGFLGVQGDSVYAILPHNISTLVTPEGAGTISITSETATDNLEIAGQTVTFTVTPSGGYGIDNVAVRLGNGESVPLTDNGNGTYSFTMPNADVTIYGDFEKVAYQITTVVLPPGAGTISLIAPSNQEWIPVGQLVEFKVTSGAGYRLIGVTMSYVDENNVTQTITLTSDQNRYSFIMPAADVTITAEFVKQYQIITECVPAEGGNISISGGYTYALPGETVSFDVNTNSGYLLKSVKMEYLDENGVEQTIVYDINDPDSFTFTMPTSNAIITATFDKLYSITTQCTPPEGGTINLTETEAVWLDPLTFTVDANPGYALTDVRVTYVDVNGHTVYYSLTPDENGVYHLAMPRADVTVIAMFDKLYTITKQCTPPEGGTIYLSADTSVEGEEHSFMVSSSPGYHLIDVTMTYVDENDVTQFVTLTPSASGTYSFVMPAADVTINANFEPYPYGISVVSDPQEGGDVTLTGDAADGNEFAGQTVVVNVGSNDGYQVGSVTVTIDGTNRTVPVTNLGNGNYSFVMPFGNVTVTAHFNSGYYHIYTVCSPPEGGDFVDLDDVNYVQEGSQVSFGVTANDYYVFNHLTATNSVTGEVEVLEVDYYDILEDGRTYYYTFEMPEADVTLTAYFDAGYKVTCVISPDEEDVGFAEIYRIPDGSNARELDIFFQPGEQVNVDIFEQPGYLLDYVTVTRDDNGESITYQNVGQEEDPDCEYTSIFYKNFIMPEGDVTVTVVFKPYTPLGFIEDRRWGPVDGDKVVVSDTWIVVWAAKDYLWAKDMVKSNDYIGQPEGTRDYVMVDLKTQTKDWDQSNWVILDCSALYPGLSTIQRREKLNEFVDHKIKPATVQGTYHCERTNASKYGHTIALSDEHYPEIVPYVINDVSNSLGYPGYLQDPREENADYDYSYNHYVPANFVTDFSNDPEGCVFKMGNNHIESLTEPINFFFIPPKDKEVAHVWAVYGGHSTADDGVDCDYFTTYEPYQGNGISQNVFDLPGFFQVELENWRFNRLRPELTDDAYGRPSNIDGTDYPLHPGDAYLFHIAIERLPLEEPEKLRGASPNTPKEPEPEIYGRDRRYVVLPLDMDSHEHTYTSVKTIYSRDASEITSIRYYNVMGQESETPFDGINIMVIRYKDGSFWSSKIMK